MRYSQILVEKRRLEFRRDLWHQKTRRIALSCGIKNIAGKFFELVTKRACERQTDGQNYDSQDRASIAASRGKNCTSLLLSLTITTEHLTRSSRNVQTSMTQ